VDDIHPGSVPVAHWLGNVAHATPRVLGDCNRRYNMNVTRKAACLTMALLLGLAPAAAKDYYVSATRGRGKKGTKAKPAKRIESLLKKLKPGDTNHVAGGVYEGRAGSGCVEINVPVKIIGGYDDTFSLRNPWGAHRTILTGKNRSKNYKNAVRLRIFLDRFNREKRMEFHRNRKITHYEVLVDGVIVDNGPRNRYKSPGKRPKRRQARAVSPIPQYMLPGKGLETLAP